MIHNALSRFCYILLDFVTNFPNGDFKVFSESFSNNKLIYIWDEFFFGGIFISFLIKSYQSKINNEPERNITQTHTKNKEKE